MEDTAGSNPVICPTPRVEPEIPEVLKLVTGHWDRWQVKTTVGNAATGVQTSNVTLMESLQMQFGNDAAGFKHMISHIWVKVVCFQLSQCATPYPQGYL